MVKTREEIYAEAERSRARKAEIVRRRQEKEIDRARKLKRLRDRDAKRTKAMAEKRAAVLQAKREAEIEKRRAALPDAAVRVDRRASMVEEQDWLGLSVADKYFRHQIKKHATSIVAQAIRRGQIARGPCAECGSTGKTEGHHRDYRLLLDVVWLCRSCHKTMHGRNKREQFGLENFGPEPKKIENAVHSTVPESLLNHSCIDAAEHSAQSTESAQDTKAGNIGPNGADAVFREGREIVLAENEERP